MGILNSMAGNTKKVFHHSKPPPHKKTKFSTNIHAWVGFICHMPLKIPLIFFLTSFLTASLIRCVEEKMFDRWWCSVIAINNLVCYHYQDKYFSTDLLPARTAARQGPLKSWGTFVSAQPDVGTLKDQDTPATPGHTRPH